MIIIILAVIVGLLVIYRNRFNFSSWKGTLLTAAIDGVTMTTMKMDDDDDDMDEDGEDDGDDDDDDDYVPRRS